MEFIKTAIPHSELSINAYLKKNVKQSILFIHGGPGFNSLPLQYLIEEHNLFKNLNANLYLYDQAGCGNSKKKPSYSHQNNIQDLFQVIELVSQNNSIDAVIGHSYGAKLLSDYLKVFNDNFLPIFVGSSESIITPRATNLLLDLNWLKNTNALEYQDFYNELQEDMSNETILNLSQKIAHFFFKNPNRANVYWANMNYKNIVLNFQKSNSYDVNMEVFKHVRAELYSNVNNFQVESKNAIWINGFHDLIMQGYKKILTCKKSYIFTKSAHYPHIEENEKFCLLMNDYLRKMKS